MRFAEELDFRGDGGYIVVPPSIHENGKAYEWDLEVGIDPSEDPAPLPESVIKLISQKEEKPRLVIGDISGGIVRGTRNDRLASFAGHLLAQGQTVEMTCVNVMAANRAYCRDSSGNPDPLPDDEVETIVGSIAQCEQRKKTASAKEAAQGRRPLLKDPKLWDDPVDGAELIEEMITLLTRYIVLPQECALAIALWVAYSHLHLECFVSPYLCISSPLKQCGKSRLAELIAGMVPRALMQINASPAAVFRIIEKKNPTLVFDEADAWLHDKEDLRSIFNSGWTIAQASVVRCEGDKHEPREFATWCPKVFVLIGRLPDTLEDRSIVIEMKRKSRTEIVHRLRSDRISCELDPLLRKAARWTRDHRDQLEAADPQVPEGLSDRAADNWRPLLAVAEAVGNDWPKRASEAAATLAGRTRADDGEHRVQLLADMKHVFGDSERMCTTDILTKLIAMETRPWANFNRGSPINGNQLSRLLKDFRIESRHWRDCRGYVREDLDDAFERYLSISVVTAQVSPEDSELPLFDLASEVTPVTAVTGIEDGSEREPVLAPLPEPGKEKL